MQSLKVKTKTKGILVTVEGENGTGKSTLIEGLSARLDKAGIDHLTLREPGGTELGQRIRMDLLSGKVSDPVTQLMLLNAARRENVLQIIKPALDRGQLVIMDRFVLSSMVHQGSATGLLDMHQVLELHQLMIGPLPDLCMVIETNPSSVLNRLKERSMQDTNHEKDYFEIHQRKAIENRMRLYRNGLTLLQMAKPSIKGMIIHNHQGEQEAAITQMLTAIQYRRPLYLEG